MNAGRVIALALLCLSTQAYAQSDPDTPPSNRVPMTFHGVSAPLSELATRQVPVAPGMGQFQEDHVERLFEEPVPPREGPELQPFVQTETPQPFAAVAGASFEGPGVGLAGFSMTGAPPDTTLAVGPNHVIAWVNSQYAIFNKAGTLQLGPINGNTLFTGLGNVCETTNRGDPILQYDRLADRWILSQFAFNVSGSAPVAPYLQCIAVSTSNNPAGTYVRYSVNFGSTSPNGFNDYGKLGVWPDGYYIGYNIFGGSPAGSNTGAGLCVSDRVKMLAGDPTATTLCAPVDFYAGGAAFLPADLDGTTLPSTTSQGGLFMRVSTAPALRIMKLKPNFAAGTVTLTNGFGGASGSYVDLALPATTFACNGTGGTCIDQPGTTNKLDTLGSRLMYRLAFRNRGGVESMVVTHSVDPDGAGARDAVLRWYEIRNPLGNPADVVVANRPVIFQNGTYDPGASGERWMGSIAMDGSGNMMMGYSVANAATGLKPSIGIAGREVGDALNTLQTEIVALTGTGSQTGTLTRWGDYTTIQVDPSDDRTFWFIGQYLAADGTFNWRTRIVSYAFPVANTFSINDVAQAEGNAGSANATFTVTRTNNTSASSVQVQSANGTATAGSDYTALPLTTVNFTAGGALTSTVNVAISGDTVLEANETFTVGLSNPTNGTISDASGTGTINNDDAASIAIGDRTLVEGNAGNTAFQFTVTLTGAVQGGFTVPVSSANGTATAGTDYTAISGGSVLTFAGTAGETQTATVQVTGDTVLEANETFTVALGTPSNAAVTVSDASGLGSITNDDAASLAIGDRTLAEGNAGNTAFQFTVTLTGAVQGGFTLPISSANGTATAGSDYTAIAGGSVLTFAGTAGETQTATVQVTGDTVLEANETFTVALGTASNAAVTNSDASGLGTITNDDAASVAIGDRTLAEGNAGNTAFQFTVTLTGAVPGGFTVPVSSANGTATAGSDFTAVAAGTLLTFAGTAGETQTATVQVTGDTVLESNETFTVALGTPSNAAVTVSDNSGLGTISNDDAASLAIGDRTLAEGNAGNTAFQFTVTLTGAVQGGFTVPVSSANGTATAGSDYTAIAAGTLLTFVGTAGETQTATVQVTGDTVLEANETFTVALGTASNAAVTNSDASGAGSITNDDAASIAIGDRTLAEGNAGNTAFQFTVTLTGAVQGGFTVPVSSANGTATAGSDYTAIAAGTLLTFVGTAGETQTATVQVTGDTVLEANETFTVALGTASNAAVTNSDASGAGSITNDDAASLAIGDRTLAEGNAGNTAFQFTVTLTGAVQGGFTVPVSSANGTATAGSDFTAIAGGTILTFVGTAGETQTATVQVTGDTVLEANETFTVALGTASNAAVTNSDASGAGSITNDDAASLAIGDRTLAEGNAGNTAFQFTVTLTGAVQGGFTLPISSANGTATAGSDYTAIAGGTLLTFVGTAGETQTATVQVTGDTVLEANETFTVALGTASNAAVTNSDASGAGSITNDDAASIAIGDRTLAEGNAGNTAFQFTVTLTGAVQGGFTVPVSSANGTATAGSDYTAIAGGTLLTFAGTAGETQTATLQVTGDLIAEADETFSVALGSPSTAGITLSDGTGLGTITNDDLSADIVVSISDGRTELPPDFPTVYALTVSNTSALIDVAAVNIQQTLAPQLTSVSWTCSGTAGASCPASGSGAVAQTLALPHGGVLTFLVTASVASGTAAGTPVATSVTATVNAPHSDPNPANNSATDSNTVLAQILLINGFE